jgi:hypothetical protein
VPQRIFDGLRRRITFANVTSLLALFVALGGVGYATAAIQKNSIGEKQLRSNSVGDSELQKDSVGESELQPDSVGTAELRAKAVGLEQMKEDSVSTQQLTARAVGAEQLQDDAVGTAQLHQLAVGLAQLKLGAVGSAQMQPQAVGTDQLKTDAVGTDQLKQLAVGAEQMKLAAVGAAQLKDDSIGLAKMKSQSVGSAQVVNGSLEKKHFKAGELPGVSLGYANRDVGGSPESVPQGPSNAGVLNLDVAAGTNGYASTSGVVTAGAASRLIANGHVVLRNNTASTQTRKCRLALYHAGVGDQTPFATQSNAFAYANEEAVLPISGGIDVAPGSYNVRVQCFSDPSAAGTFSFIRGSLTVTVASK